MSGKLDQSLDQIMTDRKTANPRGRAGGKGRPVRKAGVRAQAAIAAPAGGIQKNNRGTKTAPRAPAVIAPTAGVSKILVSNLPEDVSETLIKDFFGKAVGQVRKVLLAYGPNGRSRGEATVIFSDSASAAQAQRDYNTVKVDGRPMKIELIASASAVLSQPAKTLQDRIAKPKNVTKERTKTGALAATTKTSGKPAGDSAANGKGKKRTGRAGRAKPKTAEELDAEMQDYFGGETTNTAVNGQATANGTAQPAAAANGDAGMEDEVM